MARPKGRDSWREKKWYDIESPQMFGSIKVGETLASEPEKVKGRVIETTLGDLTDDFSKNHIKVFLKIRDVEDDVAKTEFMSHDMSREYVRSQVRRRATKVDVITDITTSDGREVRITAIAVTLNRATRPQRKSIHKRMDEFIQEKAAEYDFEQLAQQMVLGKFASDIYQNVDDICPIRRIEVKKSKLLEKE